MDIMTAGTSFRDYFIDGSVAEKVVAVWKLSSDTCLIKKALTRPGLNCPGGLEKMRVWMPSGSRLDLRHDITVTITQAIYL